MKYLNKKQFMLFCLLRICRNKALKHEDKSLPMDFLRRATRPFLTHIPISMGMIRIYFATFCFICFFSAHADDCIQFKKSPIIEIRAQEWKKDVVQPLTPMDLLHGNVIATMSEEYNLQANVEYIEDGACVVLESVSATIGYSDFLVQIDSRHLPGSCAYNITLTHENEHIRAHLAIIEDNAKEIRQSLDAAANSIEPIFVQNSDIDLAIDRMNFEIQSHPTIVLLRQKLKAEEEIRNKKIDQQDNGKKILDCEKN